MAKNQLIRRLNFTGRKKIPKENLVIQLYFNVSGVQEFHAFLDSLKELSLPSEARVFVEAFHRSSYMRFSFGTVGKIIPTTNRSLTEFDQGILPLFRVKVVDQSNEIGRVLAVADKIVPKKTEDEPTSKICLLPVEYRDLESLIWELDLDDQPVLYLNQRIENIREISRSDKSFMGLVYPEVVRKIFEHLYREELLFETGDLDSWENQ